MSGVLCGQNAITLTVFDMPVRCGAHVAPDPDL